MLLSYCCHWWKGSVTWRCPCDSKTTETLVFALQIKLVLSYSSSVTLEKDRLFLVYLKQFDFLSNCPRMQKQNISVNELFHNPWNQFNSATSSTTKLHCKTRITCLAKHDLHKNYTILRQQCWNQCSVIRVNTVNSDFVNLLIIQSKFWPSQKNARSVFPLPFESPEFWNNFHFYRTFKKLDSTEAV